MASLKIATLVIRTVAKPIASRIKTQAKEHDRFRTFCVDLAQLLHRSEIQLRTNILGEPTRHVRPLSESRAIENGANFLAEGFLFTVAASLIISETWRSSRSQSKRRDTVDDQLQDLNDQVIELTGKVNTLDQKWGDEIQSVRNRNDELTRVLERILWIGLKGGWTDVHSEEWKHEFDSILAVASLPLITCLVTR
ncbi:hypothetical protein Agabi119p4_10250 [Agaricus bisporus var. burnettii]|uniref:OPA3-domain-containing protein n=1 Tax=Agaricus bisporus var. burnettii TaxID=192524 RepID=A0A8H7EW98_AGABI|nr:hypothetical protein Agabi119p4_10250 [Agaricus bisporus var. burnettii]